MNPCCLFLVLIIGSLLTGCTGGGPDLPPLPELAEVTGVVTRAGQPLENVYVTFTPESGEAAESSGGTTDSSGQFTLTYQYRAPGAVLGNHRVRIDMTDPDGPPDLIPLRYRNEETSGLKAEVQQEGENHFEFDLK